MLKFAVLLAVVSSLSQPVSTSLVDGGRGDASHPPSPWWPPLDPPRTEDAASAPLSALGLLPPLMTVSGKPIRGGDGGADASIRRRVKRKVISRGGYYIVRSSSGSSPWSSSSYDSGNAYHNSRYQGYGYNTRGPIGDGGSRMHPFPTEGAEKRRHNRRATRKRLNRSFKREIARYALMYGPEQTAKHYAPSIGRRLKKHVIDKFVDRHRDSFQNLKKRRKNRKAKMKHSGAEEKHVE